MSNSFILVKGVTVVAPIALHDAARELTAINYMDPEQRSNISIPLAATADGTTTHYAGSWGTTTSQFWEGVVQGSLADPALFPDWVDTDLIATAYANWQLWDPDSLIQSMSTADDFDPLKINMIPRRGIRFREALDHLEALSSPLTRVVQTGV